MATAYDRVPAALRHYGLNCDFLRRAVQPHVGNAEVMKPQVDDDEAALPHCKALVPQVDNGKAVPPHGKVRRLHTDPLEVVRLLG